MKRLEQIITDVLEKSEDEKLDSSDTVQIDRDDAEAVAGGACPPVFDDTAIELPEI